MDALHALGVDDCVDERGRVRRTNASAQNAFFTRGALPHAAPAHATAASLGPLERSAAAGQEIASIYRVQRSAQGLIQKPNAHAVANGPSTSALPPLIQPMPIRAVGLPISAAGSAFIAAPSAAQTASAFSQRQPQQQSQMLQRPFAQHPQNQLVPRTSDVLMSDPSPPLALPSKPMLLVHLHHQERLSPLLDLLELRNTLVATLTSGSDLHRQGEGASSVRFFVVHEQDLALEQDRKRYAQRLRPQASLDCPAVLICMRPFVDARGHFDVHHDCLATKMIDDFKLAAAVHVFCVSEWSECAEIIDRELEQREPEGLKQSQERCQLDPQLPEANVDTWFERMLTISAADWALDDPQRFAVMEAFGSVNAMLNASPEALRVSAPTGASFLTRQQADTIKHSASNMPT